MGKPSHVQGCGYLRKQEGERSLSLAAASLLIGMEP